MSKKTKRKLVCPKTHQGKKVRSVKGACVIVLASGKKKRVKKVTPDARRSREIAHVKKHGWKAYGAESVERSRQAFPMRGRR